LCEPCQWQRLWWSSLTLPVLPSHVCPVSLLSTAGKLS
jgi:hypothetical protein